MPNKPALVFTHEGQPIKNYGKIIQNMHYDEIKQTIIDVYNQGSNVVEELKLITNMPKSVYTVKMPRSIPPKSKAQIILSLDAKALFNNEKIREIVIEFEYNEVKVIEVE